MVSPMVRNDPLDRARIPSDEFICSSIKFKVEHWPASGSRFVGKKGNQVPSDKYQAFYTSGGASWTVSISAGEHGDEVIYRMVGTMQGKEPIDISGTKRNKVMKDAMGPNGFAIIGEKAQRSAPEYFCLRGHHVQKTDLTTQEIFERLRQGTKVSSKPAVDSTKSMRHATTKAREHIDQLPTNELRVQAAFKLV